MAESLSHKLGQLIGELLELALEPPLREFAKKHNLYLDKQGDRPARPGRKVSWTDGSNNKHDLDFVLERGGSDHKVGIPVAFIESAWRRYTKHSRNKAQEIQGAVLPLAIKYNHSSPFVGVVLAGEFTEGALTQLKSVNISVLYFPYKTVLQAFGKFGIDVSTDELTTDAEFRKKIDSWVAWKRKEDIAKELLALNKQNFDSFIASLTHSVSRYIERIIILPLHGHETVSTTVTDAIAFLEKYSEENSKEPFIRYEIIIKYNNGDRVDVSFQDKNDSIKFLETYI